MSTLISRTTKAVDWLFDQQHAALTDAFETEAARDELIADIAADKFKAKLAKLDPEYFRAGLESFSAEEAPAAFAMFLADPQGFRDMLVGKMIEQMELDSEIEAMVAVEKIEREDWIRQEVEYFYNHA